MKKILLIQTAFLGDVILTTPLAQRIKKTFENCELSFLTTPTGSEILKGNKYIDNIIIYDKHNTEGSFAALIKKSIQLKKMKFDIVFVPHRSLRSSLLAFLSRIPVRVGYYESAGSYLLNTKVRRKMEQHEIERILSLLTPFDKSVKPAPPSLFPSEKDYQFVYDELKDVFTQPFGWKVVIAPGATWGAKKYPSIYYAEVGRLLLDAGVRYIIIMGGQNDFKLCEEIRCNIGDGAINVAGKFTPLQSTALISACSILISNDSAPAHMASAVGIPTVVLFGPTVPAFGFSPYNQLTAIMELNLKCRPCSPHGPRSCPLGHHMCLRNIQPYHVAIAALDLITKKFFLLRTNPEMFKFPPPPNFDERNI